MSLILELQHDATNSNISISELLRKALIVAKKLDLKDFETWIRNEMNGYPDKSTIPKYREIYGVCRCFNPYRGWQDVYFNTNKEKEHITFRKIVIKVSELENFSKNPSNIVTMDFSVELQRMFAKQFNGLVPKLIIGHNQINSILDSVKDKILEWALNLESEGILGENMSFNSQEKEAAKNVTVTNNIGNIYGSQFQQGDYNSNVMNNDQENMGDIKDLVKNIKQLILKMDESESKKIVESDINTVEQQLCSPSPKMMIIRELLSSTRSILEGSCSSLLAATPFVQEGFKKIFGA